MKLLGVLYRHHILHVFHHTYHRCVATVVGTHRTHIGVADVMTHLAVLHVVAQSDKCLCQRVHGVGVLAEEMKSQAKSSLSPDAGKAGNLAHGLFQKR